MNVMLYVMDWIGFSVVRISVAISCNLAVVR